MIYKMIYIYNIYTTPKKEKKENENKTRIRKKMKDKGRQ